MIKLHPLGGEPIYKLIGAEIKFFDLLMPHDKGFINFENQKYPWQSWAEILKPFPTTEIWATYQNSFYSGKPAVIYRKLNKGSVVYVGADSWNGSLEKGVILKVYQNQNISVKKYPEGIMVEYRDGYGIAVNYSDKPYHLDLNSTDVVIIGKATWSPQVLLFGSTEIFNQDYQLNIDGMYIPGKNIMLQNR